MGTKNITLAIDEDILARARVIAALEETTVNAMVREFLVKTTQERSKTAKVRKRLALRSRESKGRIGPINWTRDELHER